MTQLFLDNKEVVVSESNAIKIVSENPIITDAGEYTMEVTLPLSIPQNLQFFPSWQRLEVSKQRKTYKARLMVSNRPLMEGTAKVTTVNENEVRVQLLASKSEANAELKSLYIDQMPQTLLNTTFELGSGPASISNGFFGIPDCYVYAPVYCQGADTFNRSGFLFDIINPITVRVNSDRTVTYANVCDDIGDLLHYKGTFRPLWNLLHAIRCVCDAAGYTADISLLDREPLNRMYIAYPKAFLGDALPHWTAQQFLQQIELFFNVHADIDPKARTITFRPKGSVLDDSPVETIVPADNFTTTVQEDADAQYAFSNSVRYIVNGSSHDYDIIDDDRWKELPKKTFDTQEELQAEWCTASGADKKNYVWVSGDIAICRFLISDNNGTEEEQAIRINMFGRVGNANLYASDCHIVPAAIQEVPYAYYVGDTLKTTATAVIPVIEQYVSETYQAQDSIQDILEGWAEAETNTADSTSEDKGDCIEIVIIDGTLSHLTGEAFFTDPDIIRLGIPMPYTSHEYKGRYLGHLHYSLERQGRYAFVDDQDGKAIQIDAHHLHTLHFLSQTIPDPKAIFHFCGKRYLCKKIETNIVNGQLAPLMTGEFYELLT